MPCVLGGGFTILSYFACSGCEKMGLAFFFKNFHWNDV